MNGTGFSRRVTLSTLDQFSDYLSSANSRTGGGTGRAGASKKTSGGLFDGKSLGIRMTFKRPDRPSGGTSDAAEDKPPSTVSMADRQLLWRKQLAASDCQRQPGNPTGGVRLTQARFNDPVTRRRINQTTYFRNLFANFKWNEVRRSPFVEEASVPFHVMLRGQDFGIRDLVVSHKPTGEAHQSNYTTILKWTGITTEVHGLNLTDFTLRLYDPQPASGPYLLVVS